jgi:hypothetical protein
VYVAGREFTTSNNDAKLVACYWKNGERIALTRGNTDAWAYGIAVSGNDVYVAGYERNSSGINVACYWKNGQQIILTRGNTRHTGTRAIIVSGNDVYVAGYDKNSSGTDIFCYWKNGERIDITGGTGISDIAVVGR